MEMLSKPLPFTILVTEVGNRLVEAVLLMPKIQDRKVRRVGVVSMTPLAEQDVPPGVKRLIDYKGRPWGGLLDSFNMESNGQINKATT
jgi:hypothetical protein